MHVKDPLRTFCCPYLGCRVILPYLVRVSEIELHLKSHEMSNEDVQKEGKRKRKRKSVSLSIYRLDGDP